MKALMFVVILLLVVIVGLGFYRGWFRLSVDNTEHQPSATFTMDKDKMHEDEQKSKEEMHSIGQKTKETIGDRADKVKAPERQP